MKTRDLSAAQFKRKMLALGFEPEGFLGYWKLPPPFNYASVSMFNGGARRRDRLAYMIEAHEREQTKPRINS